MLELPPDHLVDHSNVRLDDADDLGGDVFIHVIRNRDARKAVANEGDGDVNALEESLGVYAGEHEATFVKRLWTLSRCADANGREGMALAGKEAGFLRQGATVADHAECIHLQAVVVVEAERFMLNHATVKFETAGLETLTATWMATVQDWHVVLLCHLGI